MLVEFYNEDARKEFLEPNSVDLFLVHPPFFYTSKRYGGDIDLQLHNTEDEEEYYSSIITTVKNMEKALSEDGNILLIVQNDYHSFKIISQITNQTKLTVFKTIFWSYEENFHRTLDGRQTNLILQLRKNKHFLYPVAGLDRLFINMSWNSFHKSLHKYHDLGIYLADAFPQDLSDFLVPLFSKEGDTVADIFGGTGTTVISAIKNNRKAIYNDSSLDQFKLAQERVDDIINAQAIKEKDKKMNKEDAINLMVETINETNRFLCQQAGMDESQTNQQIEQSRSSMQLIVSMLYEKMKENNLLA
jgi:DNA modification methylase